MIKKGNFEKEQFAATKYFIKKPQFKANVDWFHIIISLILEEKLMPEKKRNIKSEKEFKHLSLVFGLNMLHFKELHVIARYAVWRKALPGYDHAYFPHVSFFF